MVHILLSVRNRCQLNVDMLHGFESVIFFWKTSTRIWVVAGLQCVLRSATEMAHGGWPSYCSLECSTRVGVELFSSVHLKLDLKVSSKIKKRTIPTSITESQTIVLGDIRHQRISEEID